MSSFLATNNFKWERGEFEVVDTCKFPADLNLSEAGANLGITPRGKAMAYKAGSIIELAYAQPDGSFLGFLLVDVDLYGTTSELGQLHFMRNQIPIPNKKGSVCQIRVPFPRAEIVVEDLPNKAVGIDRFLVTSGDNHIGADTPVLTELTLEDGAWRIATYEEFVYGRMMNAALTPLTASNIRCRIEVVAPYRLAPEPASS